MTNEMVLIQRDKKPVYEDENHWINVWDLRLCLKDCSESGGKDHCLKQKFQDLRNGPVRFPRPGKEASDENERSGSDD